MIFFKLIFSFSYFHKQKKIKILNDEKNLKFIRINLYGIRKLIKEKQREEKLKFSFARKTSYAGHFTKR